ncbi:DHA2 family efflux MFS transporter permease subunit [Nostoc sp. UCD121]|uniref:DHA2 family efflux MFS transporter permease subunit n=1 Tax=unclassified Nostoc TaxID=2593658 RepID=UPI001628AEEB|nr:MULTISPECIES: DHA2 family efflux MFS transporter permease subunit [unclassified Nostoc]MBC1224762.1 DHA2 family efflux MFS transporter permease subunit [Nostoc sp. UCD120]MBC1276251.1 DHA2 family efflux MFS transporter permease subunit [Nostoc sp. UCD121]MBC1294948.1 DHA2 family efflux MFS transporter permease subunit [Nostoc sp. UCD122]
MTGQSSPVPPQKRSPKTAAKVNKWLITFTIMISTSLAVIDTSIVNVAIPKIQASFEASIDQVGAVTTFYIISNVIVMPLAGYLNNLLGRKQFFAGAIILFTIASLLCGLSWNLSSLICFRILQGIGGGVLIPTAQAILLETFPKEEHGKAMGIFGLGVIVNPAIGPVLGGYLTDTVGWRSIFAVNLLPGIFAAVMVLLFIHNPPFLKKPEGKFDWQGLTTLMIGLSTLQYLLENGQRLGWFSSKLVIFLTLIALVNLVYLVRRERIIHYPIIDLSAFGNSTFVAGNIISFLTGFSLYGLLFVLPIFMSHILHFNTTQMGLALMPGALSMAVMMPVAGRLADHLDPRISLGLGIGIFVGATWQFSYLTVHSGYWDLFWPQIGRGIGLGLVFVPLSTATLGSISTAKRVSASGLYNLIRQLGGSLGIAMLTVMLQRLQAFHFYKLNQGVTAQALITLPDLHQTAAILAYNDLFRYSALIFTASYLPLLFLKVKRTSR